MDMTSDVDRDDGAQASVGTSLFLVPLMVFFLERGTRQR